MTSATTPDLAFEWVNDGVSGRGVVERRFDVRANGRLVPGVLWAPADPSGDAAGMAPPPPGGRPLVLAGHGASGHKGQGYLLALGRRLVRHHGMSVAAIDGPIHGDRRPDGGRDENRVFLEFAQAWGNDPSLTDSMVEDWKATLDALSGRPEVGVGPVGYWGLSMGTIFGLPFVAAEPRVRAAVLGLMGTLAPTGDRLAADAARIGCGVHYLIQWDDELIDRQGALALFDAVGTRDKRLHVNTGPHSAVPPEEFGLTGLFLAERLGREEPA